MEAGKETRPPRGALIVIAVGLIACAAAALLRTDGSSGAETLAWGEPRSIPDSAPAAVPGGGTMRIDGAGLRVTAANISGYRLFRVAGALELRDAAAPGRARCLVRVPSSTSAARTPNGRAALPQPSNELSDQPVPRLMRIEFNAQGTDLALVNLADAFRRFTTGPGVKVEWTPYAKAQQGWDWALPAKRSGKPLTLTFVSVWRSTAKPTARIACTVKTDAGTARAKTAGAF